MNRRTFITLASVAPIAAAAAVGAAPAPPPELFVGVDLGKGEDHTAIVMNGPNVQHLEFIHDLRDMDPDRLMAAFIKPLKAMANKRII
jgi:hypothetical protein